MPKPKLDGKPGRYILKIHHFIETARFIADSGHCVPADKVRLLWRYINKRIACFRYFDHCGPVSLGDHTYLIEVLIAIYHILEPCQTPTANPRQAHRLADEVGVAGKAAPGQNLVSWLELAEDDEPLPAATSAPSPPDPLSEEAMVNKDERDTAPSKALFDVKQDRYAVLFALIVVFFDLDSIRNSVTRLIQGGQIRPDRRRTARNGGRRASVGCATTALSRLRASRSSYKTTCSSARFRWWCGRGASKKSLGGYWVQVAGRSVGELDPDGR
ncbi:hypothetical protein ACQY0O_008440 [Thecaphora frezii]